MRQLYAALLDLTGKKCLVAGGGKVAERKTRGLLDSGAAVALVSPEWTPTLEDWVGQGLVQGFRRPFQTEDLDGIWAVFAATNHPGVNRRIALEARERGIWVNAADAPERSTFHVPSVLRRGRLNISISTSGASPAAAARIRREIGDRYGEEYEDYMDFLAELRSEVRQQVKEPGRRAEILREAAAFDIPAWIRQGRFSTWRDYVFKELARQGDRFTWSLPPDQEVWDENDQSGNPQK